MDEQTAQQLQKEEEQELGSEFDEVYARFQKNAVKMMSSGARAGYRKIRNNLIAHNALLKTDAGYDSFDIKDLGLKHGQERKLLEAVRTIVDDLDLLVRSHCFLWDSFFEIHEKNVCIFWKIPKIE